MYYQVAVIQALKENSKGLSNTDLHKRVREILSMYDMDISKDAFTETLKTLIDSEVLTKKQVMKKAVGRPMIYTIRNGKYVQNQIKLITEVGKAPKLIDYIKDVLESYERASFNIDNSNHKDKKKLINELNENLILLAKITPPMIAKMILYQSQSIENPFLLKEIKKLEKDSRKMFNKAGVLSKKMGKEYHDKFISEFDNIFTSELSTNYNKFLKKNTIFPSN